MAIKVEIEGQEQSGEDQDADVDSKQSETDVEMVLPLHDLLVETCEKHRDTNRVDARVEGETGSTFGQAKDTRQADIITEALCHRTPCQPYLLCAGKEELGCKRCRRHRVKSIKRLGYSCTGIIIDE